MTRLSWIAGVVMLAATAAPSRAQAPADADFVALKAWEAEGRGMTARASDDSLLLTAGTIRTNALYADFVLRFEYRLSKPDARGELHVRSFFDAGSRVLRGYTVTLDGTARRGRVRGRSHFPREQRLASLAPVAPGAWVACEIRAEGDRLTVAVDGVAVTEASPLNDIAGFVAFTGSNGGLELRGVRVAPVGVRLDLFPTTLPAANAAGITAPTVAYQERPVYPRAPFDLRLEGVVLMDIALDSEGRLTHVRVVKSPHPDFAMNAVACARTWRFTPAMKDGAPIAVVAKLEVSFNLEK